MRALAILATVCVTSSAFAQGAAAPKGRCKFIFENTPTTTLQTFQLPSKQYNSFIGQGVIARCPSQGLVLKSDSLEVYGDDGRYFFIGHVDYKDAKRITLKSDFLTYFQREERLLAIGQAVEATMPTGSTMKGTSLEYFRVIPKVRLQPKVIAITRPTITLVEKDAQGKAQPPVTVTANTVVMEGDSLVSAVGNVIVVRPELTATGDSLYLDSGKGMLRIMRNPKIVGTKGRPFTLVGETIDLLSRQKKLERVLAKSKAEAESEDLKLKSDTIDMRVTNDLLQRAIAWGKNRATATSQSQTVVSDSIDVVMPGQRMKEMHAIRKASAEGMPDTTKFKTKERDRLLGDTIHAVFETLAAGDSAKPRIKSLLAIGDASSLQHLAPRDTACHLPAINYVKGRTIEVAFEAAVISKVVIKDTAAATGTMIQPDSTCNGTLGKDAKAAPPPAPAGTTPPRSPAATSTPPVAKPEDTIVHARPS
ncbi:MAG: hypothetical protein V4550_01175 [Gemmatimonadota bacterium]